MKKTTFFVIVSLTFGLWASAQTLSPTVIATDAAQNKTPTMSLDWTLGELSVDSRQTAGGMLTEGFHQPLKITEIPTTNTDLENHPSATNANIENFNHQVSDIQIKVWPNPVHSTLNAKIEASPSDEILFELFDKKGQRITATNDLNAANSIELNLSKYPPGVYLLRFSLKDGTLIKTFQITKQ